MSRPNFANEPLADMVAIGAVTADSARLWARADRPGRLTADLDNDDGGRGSASMRVEASGANDQTTTFDLPGLSPLTRYRYRVTREGGGVIGEGSFETAPASMADTPRHFSIAMGSCHQPFTTRGNPARGRCK